MNRNPAPNPPHAPNGEAVVTRRRVIELRLTPQGWSMHEVPALEAARHARLLDEERAREGLR